MKTRSCTEMSESETQKWVKLRSYKRRQSRKARPALA